MGRARRNPFRGLVDHISEMNRMQERWMGGYDTAHEDQRRTHATAWVPTTDIFAKGADLVIRCELAGVRREDVEISLSGGALIVSGERRSELDEKEVGFYVRERYYGNFRRTMSLPEGVDESKVGADFQDGMLEITIRDAAAAAEPRRIEIR